MTHAPATGLPRAADKPRNTDKPFFACEPTDLGHFESAEVCFRFSRELPLSAERLFDVFEDPTSWPRWGTGIGKVEWTSPEPFGVGTTRTVTFWGGMEVYEEFLAWERGREMAFVLYGTSQEVWARFGEHYDVEPLGDDRCRLTWTVAYDPIGTFGKIHPVISRVMRANLGSYLWRLERYCKRL